MTYAACVEGIEKGLKSRDGVVLAMVSILTHEAVVNHSSAVPRADLMTAIENLGYEANVIDTDTASFNFQHVDQARVASIKGWKAAIIAATVGTLVTVLFYYLPLRVP